MTRGELAARKKEARNGWYAPRVDAAGTASDETLLQRLLASERDLDAAFENLHRRRRDGETPVVRALIPKELLGVEKTSFEEFLNSVLAELDEIESALDGLREVESADTVGDAVPGGASPVPPSLLFDGRRLEEVVEALDNDRDRFEFLLDQARDCLRRLEGYRLSRQETDTLVQALGEKENVWTIQYLVEFLRSLHRAADSFESLDLPAPHIRDYLSHLYSMKDWEEMARLVRFLERAVRAHRSDPEDDP